MAGEQPNKRQLMPSGERLAVAESSKKTRALSALPALPVSILVVKQEPGEVQVVQGGRASRARARAAAMEQANNPHAEAEVPRINVSLELRLLHCDVDGCHRPLTPLIFKCDAGHRLCSIRRGDGHCSGCGRAATFVHCGPDLDMFVGGSRVPCPFKAYGCDSSFVYHDVHETAAHRDACAYAPCACALCRFTASPPMLRDHLAADHSWRVDKIPSYGKPIPLLVRVPVSEPHSLLVVEGDERSLFVLSVRARGADVWAVSVACARARAEAGPRYSCILWVQAPAAPGMPASKGRHLQMETDVASCAVPGEAAVDEMALLVPQPMVQGPSKEIHLRVRIDLVDLAPALR